MKTNLLNPKLLRLTFEPSMLKTPVKSNNWQLPVVILAYTLIFATAFVLSKLGLVYNSISGY